jgi:signal transduction histidine kinase
MPRRGSFERRLLLALVMFSLVPSLLLIGVGTYLLSEAVALHSSAAAWQSVAESGRGLLEAVDRVGDPRLASAAARHREELSASLLQSGRWEYLNQRALRIIPVVSLLLAGLLGWLAVRSARGIARELARPIRELVGWAGQVAREEPLPAAVPGDPRETGEFGVLRQAFRAMAGELETSRARALEAERTRTWITVARSVAHELKNALTPLRLAVRVLERQAEAAPASREPLEVVGEASERLEELARTFSQFGRLPEGPASEIDLPEQLDYLMRTHLPPAVSHRLLAPIDLPRVVGHHDALARVFANLLLNAAEAMGEGGGSVTVKLAKVGEMVEVRVLDSGPGIAAEPLERIWEPDFTTKSRGTGLGLALVRQTVQAHGGHVGARNRAEGGAEFRVQLPVSYRLSAISYQPGPGSEGGAESDVPPRRGNGWLPKADESETDSR